MVAQSGRRRGAIALSGALVLVAGLIWIVRAIRTSDNRVTTATEYGTYLAAAALAVTLLGFLAQWWWKGRRGAAVPVTAAQAGVAADQLGLLDLWTAPQPRTTTATPTSTYRIDRRTSTASGLAFGLAFGLAGGPMPQVVLTELVFVASGAGRVRFMKVLEEAHGRQVLRQAGAVYQFRHAELQEYLAKIHQQGSRSSARS